MASDLENLYSRAIKEAYTLGSADDVILTTLELRHPTFLTDGEPDAVRLVSDYGTLLQSDPEIRGHLLRLEADAPWNAGEMVTFVACMFELTLAPQDTGGRPLIQISIDNVASEVCRHLDAAIEVQSPIELTLREYLASDPEAPQHVTGNARISRVSSTLQRVTATAGYADLLNAPFPKKVYRPNEFASLAR